MEQQLKQENKHLEEKYRLLNEQMKKKEQSDQSDDLAKQLIGDDNFISRQGSKINDQKSKVPSEFKQMTNQISEIRGPVSNNPNRIDKDDIDDIYFGGSSKTNQKQKSNIPKQGSTSNVQSNKFNSIASNYILEDYTAQNSKNQQIKNNYDEEVPEEGEINDEFYHDDDDDERSYDSNDPDISKDRGYNNKCEQEKEAIDIGSNKDKGKNQFNKQDQNRKNVDKGKSGSSDKKQALYNKNNYDFSEDSQFEQSQGNNNKYGKHGNQIGKSGGSMNQSNKKNQLEESSQNFDTSGYYNGPKGKIIDQQANPHIVNQHLQSFGDSFQEQILDKKAKKKFDYEESGKII